MDWYHAKEHLCQAANLIHGEGTPVAQQWVKEHEGLLFEGQAERVAHVLIGLAQCQRKITKDLRPQAAYLRDNQRRMQYVQRREENDPIGSGTAESGCGQFRRRFTSPGMRRSRKGAEQLLLVRAAILSHRFAQFWSALQPGPPK